jgi:hypothetical protein
VVLLKENTLLFHRFHRSKVRRNLTFVVQYCDPLYLNVVCALFRVEITLLEKYGLITRISLALRVPLLLFFSAIMIVLLA